MISDRECRGPVEEFLCYCKLIVQLRPAAGVASFAANSAKKDDLIAPDSPSLTLTDDGKFVYPCCSPPVRVGGSLLLCGRRRSHFPFQCMIGPDWPVVVLVYFLIFAVNGVVLGVSSACLGWPVLLLGLVGFVALVLAYSAVACSDPGIIYRPRVPPCPTPALADQVLSALESGSAAGDNASGSGDEDSLSGHGGKEGAERALLGSAPASMKSLGPGDDERQSELELQTQQAQQAPFSSALAPSSSSVAAAAAGAASSAASPLRLRTYENKVGAVQQTIECGQCQLQRPHTARHCIYCGVCVNELDHHCPWCGKCIGENNLKAFQTFLFLLCFQFYFLTGTLIYYFVACTYVNCSW